MIGVPLAALFVGAGLPRPDTEVRFHATRKWRWDYAWPAYKVAFERQGSTWSGGRHTRGKGYRDDREKVAEGQLAGWLVIEATADMIEDGLAFGLVERALEARGWIRV